MNLRYFATGSKSDTKMWLNGLILLTILAIARASEAELTVEAAFQGRCGHNSPCEQLCYEIHDGMYECDCTEGYELNKNGYSCQEINSTFQPGFDGNSGGEEDILYQKGVSFSAKLVGGYSDNQNGSDESENESNSESSNEAFENYAVWSSSSSSSSFSSSMVTRDSNIINSNKNISKNNNKINKKDNNISSSLSGDSSASVSSAESFNYNYVPDDSSMSESEVIDADNIVSKMSRKITHNNNGLNRNSEITAITSNNNSNKKKNNHHNNSNKNNKDLRGNTLTQTTMQSILIDKEDLRAVGEEQTRNNKGITQNRANSMRNSPIEGFRTLTTNNPMAVASFSSIEEDLGYYPKQDMSIYDDVNNNKLNWRQYKTYHEVPSAAVPGAGIAISAYEGYQQEEENSANFPIVNTNRNNDNNNSNNDGMKGMNNNSSSNNSRNENNYYSNNNNNNKNNNNNNENNTGKQNVSEFNSNNNNNSKGNTKNPHESNSNVMNSNGNNNDRAMDNDNSENPVNNINTTTAAIESSSNPSKAIQNDGIYYSKEFVMDSNSLPPGLSEEQCLLDCGMEGVCEFTMENTSEGDETDASVRPSIADENNANINEHQNGNNNMMIRNLVTTTSETTTPSKEGVTTTSTVATLSSMDSTANAVKPNASSDSGSGIDGGEKNMKSIVHDEKLLYNSTRYMRCLCPFGKKGKGCSEDFTTSVPRFTKKSWLAFPALRGAYKHVQLRIEFRPESYEGIILLTGERDDLTGDFMALLIHQGFIEFWFDCGSGTGSVRSKETVILNQWNSVIIYRHRWDAWLVLNHGARVQGRSKGLFSRITFREPVFLGGTGNITGLAKHLPVQDGMVGCIRRFIANEHEYKFMEHPLGDVSKGFDIQDCTTDKCVKYPCRHGGKCLPSDQGAVCLCPLGFGGDLCEMRLDLQVPSFNGSSYLRYAPLGDTCLIWLELEIIIKPESQNGLILYSGHQDHGDYIVLSLNDLLVEFAFDLGSGPALVKSEIPLNLGQWHRIRISRTARLAVLKIDKHPEVMTISPNGFWHLSLSHSLFLGGVHNLQSLPRELRARGSFVGCIQKININGRDLSIISEALGGTNVDNCPHACVAKPCSPLAQCIPLMENYECRCNPSNTQCNKAEEVSLKQQEVHDKNTFGQIIKNVLHHPHENEKQHQHHFSPSNSHHHSHHHQKQPPSLMENSPLATSASTSQSQSHPGSKTPHHKHPNGWRGEEKISWGSHFMPFIERTPFSKDPSSSILIHEKKTVNRSHETNGKDRLTTNKNKVPNDHGYIQDKDSSNRNVNTHNFIHSSGEIDDFPDPQHHKDLSPIDNGNHLQLKPSNDDNNDSEDGDNYDDNKRRHEYDKIDLMKGSEIEVGAEHFLHVTSSDFSSDSVTDTAVTLMHNNRKRKEQHTTGRRKFARKSLHHRKIFHNKNRKKTDEEVSGNELKEIEKEINFHSDGSMAKEWYEQNFYVHNKRKKNNNDDNNAETLIIKPNEDSDDRNQSKETNTNNSLSEGNIRMGNSKDKNKNDISRNEKQSDEQDDESIDFQTKELEEDMKRIMKNSNDAYSSSVSSLSSSSSSSSSLLSSPQSSYYGLSSTRQRQQHDIEFPLSGRITGYHSPPVGGKAKRTYGACFTGTDSYFHYSDAETMSQVISYKIDLNLRFKTHSNHGVILWSGRQSALDNDDFLSLGIENGYLNFRYNLGSGDISIVFNSTKVSDGLWHRVRATRNLQEGSVEVDGRKSIVQRSPGKLRQLNTDTGLYVGGMPNVAHYTRRRYYSGMVGCISEIILAGELRLNLDPFTLGTAHNVEIGIL